MLLLLSDEEILPNSLPVPDVPPKAGEIGEDGFRNEPDGFPRANPKRTRSFRAGADRAHLDDDRSEEVRRRSEARDDSQESGRRS